MKNTLQQALTRSATKILRPLARIMIRNGVSCGTFEELVRKAYVDEAFALNEEKKGKITVSSISAQTGLSRKEVKRLHDLNSEPSDSSNKQKYNRATRVISGWINDQRFTNHNGQPTPLKLNHNDSHSFATLVKLYSGDITPKAMLDLLLEAECVQTIQDNVHLIKQAYLPGNDSPEIAFILGNDANELIQTIGHNMNSESNLKRFQRKVSTHKLAKEAKKTFQHISAKHAQALLEELDAWLIEHETDDQTDTQYVSLGIYYYESNNNEESSHETQH
ncbi:hypothetical protein MNBD_GAMMA03-1379 [hydrothermal vent metagenome]|uniref:Uncharacterized protein n=1 Tax=hydrothermal vent metagenome TaxID=652676 RepID=A0A3B0WBU8_9ZZZZ